MGGRIDRRGRLHPLAFSANFGSVDSLKHADAMGRGSAAPERRLTPPPPFASIRARSSVLLPLAAVPQREGQQRFCTVAAGSRPLPGLRPSWSRRQPFDAFGP